jgi:hypothetical protein
MSHSITTIDRVRRYYLGEEIFLTPDETNLLARWEEAFTFLRDSKSVPETVTMLQRRFPTYSKRVLYRDVQSAMQLFGDVVKYSKEAMRNMANDYALDYLNRCRKSGDRNNEKAALALFIKINKLDRDEADPYDPSTNKIEPIRIEIPDHVAGMVMGLLGNGAINLMQLREKSKLNLEESNVGTVEVQSASVTPGAGTTA